MQPSKKQTNTLRSRSILFSLQQSLTTNKLTLQQLTLKVFSYQKQRFTRSQFTQLIRSVDDRLSYSDIDSLIESLDPDGNCFVFFSTLKSALSSITAQDDPFNNNLDIESSKILTRSKISGQVLTDQEKTTLLLKQLKDRIKGSDPYQLLDLFDANRDGMFDLKEFQEFLHNFGVDEQRERMLLRRRLYGEKLQLGYNGFIKALGLEGVPKRVSFQGLDDKKSHIIQHKPLDPKNIKPILKRNPSRANIKLDDDDLQASIKKPTEILAYINPLSQLQQPLQSMALQCIKQKVYFIDKKPASAANAIKYQYASNIFGRDYTLFSKSVTQDKSRIGLGMFLQTKDVMQGAVADYYLLSSISAIAFNYPQMIYRLFPLLKNPSSIFGIRLFIDGRWKTVITDAFFPVDKQNRLVYARSNNEDLWIMLIEKAMAKIYRSYEDIHLGWTEEGLNVLTGAPTEKVMVGGTQGAQNGGGVVEVIRKAVNRKCVVCCSGKVLSQATMEKQSVMGLSTGRSYTVVNVYKDIQSQNKPITLIKLRNPQGRVDWKGDWSFTSQKWTPHLRTQLSYQKPPSDGTFFLSQQHFRLFFSQAVVCHVNPTYLHSQIRIFAGRNHTHMLQLKVKTQGDYYLSIYQDSNRKFKQSHNYEKSKSRLFLASVREGRLEAIHSKAVDERDLHQEFRLRAGQYVLSCKVKWKFFDKYHFVMTVYGPEKVKIREIAKNKEFLPAFITCKAMQKYSTAKKEHYTQIGLPQCFRAWQMLPRQGYGYILINNPSDKTIQTTLNFTRCEGIKALKPQRLPIVLQIPPNQIVVRGLLVDPAGYNYSLNEKMKVLGENGNDSGGSVLMSPVMGAGSLAVIKHGSQGGGQGNVLAGSQANMLKGSQNGLAGSQSQSQGQVVMGGSQQSIGGLPGSQQNIGLLPGSQTNLQPGVKK